MKVKFLFFRFSSAKVMEGEAKSEKDVYLFFLSTIDIYICMYPLSSINFPSQRDDNRKRTKKKRGRGGAMVRVYEMGWIGSGEVCWRKERENLTLLAGL